MRRVPRWWCGRPVGRCRCGWRCRWRWRPGWRCWWRSRRTGVVAGPGGGGVLAAAAHRRRLRAGAGLGFAGRGGVVRPVAGWAESAHRAGCRGCCCRVAGRLPGAAGGGRGVGVAGGGPVAVGVAAGDRGVVGGAGGAARPDAVRRVPVGAAGVQPGRLAAAAAGRGRRRAAGDVRGGAGRRAAAWRVGVAAVAAPGRCVAAALAGVAVAVVAAARCAGAGRRCPRGAGGGRSVRVAIVQGNVPRLGLDFNAQRRAVLDNHVDATVTLAAAGRRRARRRGPTWWCGRRTPATSTRCATRTRRRGSPRPPTRSARRSWSVRCCDGPGAARSRNVGIVWRPGSGPDRRSCTSSGTRCRSPSTCRCGRWPGMITDKVDLVRTDFVAGRPRRGCSTSGRPVLGDVICFEVAYDDIVRDTVTGGAQLLVVQTNNATFDEAEARQQLAMVRLRAVEHGRAALMASTVGVSGVRRPRRAGGRRHRVQHPRRSWCGAARCATARTLATRLGPWPEVALAAGRGGAGRRGRCCAAAGRHRRRNGRRQRAGDEAGERGPARRTVPGGRPGAGDDPDLQRGRQRRLDRAAGCAAAVPAVDVLVADDNSPTAPA